MGNFPRAYIAGALKLARAHHLRGTSPKPFKEFEILGGSVKSDITKGKGRRGILLLKRGWEVAVAVDSVYYLT